MDKEAVFSMANESSILGNLDETFILLNDFTSTINMDQQLPTENAALVRSTNYFCIEDELVKDRSLGIVVEDTFDYGDNESILFFHGLLHLYLLYISLFIYWLFIVISYISCPLPDNVIKSSSNGSTSWRECDVRSTLCMISLSTSFIIQVLVVAMRVPYTEEYKKDALFDDGGKRYDLIDMLKIYKFKGALDKHMMMNFSKTYVLTFLITVILNVSTISRGITAWNVPDVFCFLIGWFFILMYVDFNVNTIMLRDALLKGTHIMGFNSIKRRTLKMIMNRFKSTLKTSFNLQCLRCLQLRKRLLMDSMKISYLESIVTVILSYYYVLSKLPFNAFSLSVLNLSMIGMICTTIASIHHNRCVNKVEDVIRAIREAQTKGTFQKYGTITEVDLEALLKNSPLVLDGEMTQLRVTLFGIPVSDAFFLNIIIIVFTSVARMVFPPVVT
jgi:hypothetical protein